LQQQMLAKIKVWGGSKIHAIANRAKKVPNISQGRAVAHLTCGTIFNDNFITQLLQSLTMKEF